MPTPTELAHDAMKHSQALRLDFELLNQLVKSGDLLGLRERLVLVEGRLAVFEQFEAELRRIGILEERIQELKNWKAETEKRHWQFVYIFAGALASLLATVVVQVVLTLIKRP